MDAVSGPAFERFVAGVADIARRNPGLQMTCTSDKTVMSKIRLVVCAREKKTSTL
jgi:hypothetical protein